MQTTSVRVGEERVMAAAAPAESPVSAISWAAIIAGAFAMAAISLILFALGTGFGFASVSPWSNSNPSAKTFGVAAAIWLIVTQWLAAAFGGSLTGRLRTKWVLAPSDEIYFRDTAHGFLAWAVAAVIAAGILTQLHRRSSARPPESPHGHCAISAGRGRKRRVSVGNDRV